jgi:hypothetical protein
MPFSIGLRNSHDKSMRLAMSCGDHVFVCSNMAFAGDFTPVLAKHSKSISLIDGISVGSQAQAQFFMFWRCGTLGDAKRTYFPLCDITQIRVTPGALQGRKSKHHLALTACLGRPLSS